MNRVSMLITLLLLFSFQVNATSAFYENRTEQPIRVRLIVNATAPAYAGDQYHLPPESDFGTVVIPPFQKAKVATFNRYYGLENGGMYDYYFLVYQLDENGIGSRNKMLLLLKSVYSDTVLAVLFPTDTKIEN